MLKFCHIAPTELIPIAASHSGCFLTLAHLVEKDSLYVENYWHAREAARAAGREIVNIMDNSGFEFYKEHGPGYVFNPEKLLNLAAMVKADYIVLPDYPGENQNKTIEAAIQFAPMFKTAGYGTFFVPQSKPGDIEGFIEAFEWAVDSDLVDYIGMSILGVPLAFDVEQGNKLQRYMSRYKMMSLLEERGLLHKASYSGKKIHFLGMVDGPNEIELCRRFADYIHTWDTSSAVWAAIEGKQYDNSPTGLVDGKIESPVDFNYSYSKIDTDTMNRIIYNINVINGQVDEYKHSYGTSIRTPNSLLSIKGSGGGGGYRGTSALDDYLLRY